jgi:preprotein translocase subunit SecY
MANVISVLKNIFKNKKTRNKILFTLSLLAIFRFTAHIPTPGIDRTSLQAIFNSSQFLTLLDVFSGGTLANFSIMAVGLSPYISASIIISMLSFIVPQMEALSKEGEYGRQKINQYTRLLTIPLAAVQSIGLISLLSSQGLLSITNPFQIVSVVVTLSAGTMLLMWFGDLITEYGVGNGVSILIFAGIIARLPVSFIQTATTTDAGSFSSLLVFIALSLGLIYAIVKTTQAERKVPITYARRTQRSGASSLKNHLPLRLNQAGVIPIIFAVSIMLIPSMVANGLKAVSNPVVKQAVDFTIKNFNQDALLFNFIYFFLILGFTYFYTAITFNPEKIADQLKKSGAFIPGVRPGSSTAQYLSYILNRTTLAGGAILGLIAITPTFLAQMTNITALSMGGTGLLIVVSVILETTKSIESQLVMHNYDKFLN